jgi:hypothetical protein
LFITPPFFSSACFLPLGYFFKRPCGYWIGAEFGKHGIGGSGEYFGENDAYLGRINVLCHVATVETCVGAAA